MKKQINPTIKAHLIRGAFYLLLLVAVCAIPFALAQRNTFKQVNPATQSKMATKFAGARPASGVAQATKLSGVHKAVSKPNADSRFLPSGAPGGPAAWVSASPYPLNIVRYGFAQTATHLYVFGGVADGTRVTNVNRFDLATGTWEPRAPMPWESEAPTCALMESTGIVYCAQGDTGNGFASYDVATDTWTPLAADPFVTDHYGSASGAFNGKVFVLGGTTAFSNAIWIYDVAMNTWSVGTAAPTGPFLLAGYQQVGQFLYVVGGFDPSAVNLTTTSRLDMSSAPGTWEAGPAFTPQRADFGLAYDALTNKLYALGGDLGNDGNFFNSTNLVDELDLSAWPGGTWSSSPPDLPAPNRQANQAGFYGNGDIWSVGGLNGATFVFLNEVWHRNNGGGTPSPTPTGTPSPTATATATPNCLDVNGGFETGSLPPWINTGDTSFTGVGPPAIPHSGSFALFSGPTTDDGFIDQTLPTVAGAAYDVTFWLSNVDDSSTNRFGASFGGVTLVPEAVQGPFDYTLFTFNNVIPGANADLHFIFYNPPSYFYLDEVCVTPSGGGSPTPTATATATPTATAAPRSTPSPRPRGTPAPRP